MRRAVLALIASACYQPMIHEGAPCDPVQSNCPTGQTCTTTGGGAFCLIGADAPLATGDGAMPDGGAGHNGDAGPNCYGTGTVHDICFAQPPSGMLTLGTVT